MAAFLTLPSPLGPLTLFEEGGELCALDWDQAADGGRATKLLTEAARQLDAYFAGALKRFDLPLAKAGSAHSEKVHRAMMNIPYGETRTYGEIARAIGSSPRAVGGACGRNPLPIIIPCHRVMGANGKMTGYSGGDGLGTKQALLDLENKETF